MAIAMVLTWCNLASAEENKTNADTSPQDILSKIHTTNQNEIRMAKLAMQKASSKDVKNFAQKMIKDHTKADQKVMKLAKQEHLTLGRYPLTAGEQGQIDNLMSASGADFDRLYMEANRAGHEHAVSMLKEAENQTMDPKVKALVAQLLPTVSHHNELAKEIHPDQHHPSS
jgi:putative membrane protein